MHPGPHGHPQQQQAPGFPPPQAPYRPGPPQGFAPGFPPPGHGPGFPAPGHGPGFPRPGHGPGFGKPKIPGRGQAITAGVLLLVIAAGYLAAGILLILKWRGDDPRYRFLGTDWRYLLAEVGIVILLALTVWAAITVLTLRGRVFATVMGVIGALAFYVLPIGILVAVFCLLPTTAKALEIAKAQRTHRR